MRRWWLVPVAVLALAAAVSPFSQQVGDVEDNGPTSQLASSADSTRVVGLQSRFAGVQQLTATVVLTRDRGLSPADEQAASGLQEALSAWDVTGRVGSDRVVLRAFAPLWLGRRGAGPNAAVRDPAPLRQPA